MASEDIPLNDTVPDSTVRYLVSETPPLKDSVSESAVQVRSVDVEDGPSVPPVVEPFREGGVQGWSTVIGVGFILFATFGNIYAFGVYQDFYTRIYLTNYTPSQISWIGSVQLMLPYLLGLFAGKLYNNGHFHLLVASGSVIHVFGIFMVSLCQPNAYYQIFLSQALCQGIGIGLAFVPAISVTNQHFKRLGALATGLAYIGVSAGAVVFPILLNRLFSNPRYGFAYGVRASGYVALGALVVGNMLVRTRYRPKAASQDPTPSMAKLLMEVPFAMTIIGSVLCGLSIFFPLFYIQLFAVERGLDINLAFYSLAIINAGSALGRASGNWMVVHLGPFNVLTPATFLSAGMILAILGIRDNASLVVVSFLYGVFSGAWVTVIISLVVSFSQSPAEISIRLGLAFLTQAMASLFAAPIQGAILTPSIFWTNAVVYSAILDFGGAFVFLIARFILGRRRHSKKV